MQGCDQLSASPHIQVLKAHFVSLSLAHRPQGAGGGDGSLSGTAPGKGLGPQPHGESEKTRLGPACPRSQDTQVWWLCWERMIIASIYAVPARPDGMF